MTSIAGYEIVTEFTTAGGGQSRWAFARRGGRDYFIKEFLSPKYPVDGAPGGEATKDRQRRQCDAFEMHHRAIIEALEPISSRGGNVVVATDFFRAGPRYFKVTDKVEVTDWSPEEVAALPIKARLLLMITVAHSLNVLHRVGLVHGDIKPPNILIKRLAGGGWGTKLIDFDNAVLTDKRLPDPKDLVGDMAYYSPEIVRYLNDGDAATRLTGGSDLFALGLVFCEWMTSQKPALDSGARYAGVAVLRGDGIAVPDMGYPAIGALVKSMLATTATERPSAEAVHRELREVRAGLPDEGDRPSPVSAPGALTTSSLRGTLGGRPRPPAPTRDAGESAGGSRLRGTLVRKDSSR